MRSIPERMRVARLYSFNDIRIEEMPVPEISDKEALIRVRACGICTGDVMPWYIEKKAPLVIGHEPAGEVVKTGSEVREFKEGDRVFIHHHAPCMNCRYCSRGDYVQCRKWRETGIYPGGISEYMLVREGVLMHDTLLLPDGVSFEDATLIEPLACVVKSLSRCGIKRGDTVLVIGLGIMGILHVILAPHFGAERVIGADRIEYRLNMARHFGAHHVINVDETDIKEGVMEFTDSHGAEIVIVGPNSVRAMEDGLRCVSDGGTVLFFTPAKPGELLTIDPNEIYFRDIKIITSYSCGPDNTRSALEFIKNGVVRAHDLVTHRFNIEETQEAFKTVAQAGESLKVIVTP